jgi:hypothetical protein
VLFPISEGRQRNKRCGIIRGDARPAERKPVSAHWAVIRRPPPPPGPPGPPPPPGLVPRGIPVGRGERWTRLGGRRMAAPAVGCDFLAGGEKHSAGSGCPRQRHARRLVSLWAPPASSGSYGPALSRRQEGLCDKIGGCIKMIMRPNGDAEQEARDDLADC